MYFFVFVLSTLFTCIIFSPKKIKDIEEDNKDNKYNKDNKDDKDNKDNKDKKTDIMGFVMEPFDEHATISLQTLNNFWNMET